MARPGRLQSGSREHEQILAAVLACQPEAACQPMREHILLKGSAVAEMVLVVFDVS